MSNTLNKAVACIQKVETAYRQSPTAQLLVNNAPAILQGFRDFRVLALQHEMELKAILANRQYDLARFKEVAPGMMRNLESILNQVYSLQNKVREFAQYANSDPDAKTVIEFTNKQINQNINLFNQLTFTLLNA